jgi:elongation factor G
MRRCSGTTEGKGDKYDVVEIPADHAEARPREWRDQAARDRRRERRRDDGAVPRGRGARPRSSSRRGDPPATIASEINPVLCGSAFKNKGVQPMLDAVVDYLPSPLDVPRSRARRWRRGEKVVERHADPDEPFSALAFKIMADPHLGKLTYIRIYSGTLETGTAGAELDQGPQGADRQDLPDAREQARGARSARAVAGDIVAVMGLKDTTTGDTLCDPPSR